MTTIVPQCELTKKAIKWVSEKVQETGRPWSELLELAAMQFNLSPKDMEFLERFFRENGVSVSSDNS